MGEMEAPRRTTPPSRSAVDFRIIRNCFLFPFAAMRNPGRRHAVTAIEAEIWGEDSSSKAIDGRNGSFFLQHHRVLIKEAGVAGRVNGSRGRGTGTSIGPSVATGAGEGIQPLGRQARQTFSLPIPALARPSAIAARDAAGISAPGAGGGLNENGESDGASYIVRSKFFH